MLRTMFYRMFYGPYLKNDDGIKEFGERCLSRLIGKVTKKSAFYREANENLLVEKSNLRILAEELERKEILDSGEYFSVWRRLWAGGAVTATILLMAVLIEYTSFVSLIRSGASTLDYAAWTVATLFAVAFIGGGIATMERFLESLLWHRRIEAQAGEPNRYESIMWGLIFVGIELTILGIADVRGSYLAQQVNSSLLYVSFVLLALMLPIIGGAIRWDALRYIDAYKRTQAQRHIETRLAQIDSILRQNDAFESTFFKMECLKAWREFVAFKAVKQTLDAARGVKEDLTGHFSASYRSFQEEANWRYEADLRDMTTLSKLPYLKNLIPPISNSNSPALTRGYRHPNGKTRAVETEA